MAKRHYNIIEITQKKSGVTYIYEDFSYWDKEKGYSTHKRKSIGKIDGQGNKVYNKYYLEKLAAIEAGTYVEEESDSVSPASEKVIPSPVAPKTQDEPIVSCTILSGQKMVLDSVCEQTALRKTLDSAFSKDDARAILALAYYVICQGKAFCHSTDWLDDRGYSDLGLTSQRISELLASISDDKMNTFFTHWMETQQKGDSLPV